MGLGFIIGSILVPWIIHIIWIGISIAIIIVVATIWNADVGLVTGISIYLVGRFAIPALQIGDALGIGKNTAPCPYCRKQLATEKAQQCRHCLMDWHDPENPRKLG